jgi:hypothetical protein
MARGRSIIRRPIEAAAFGGLGGSRWVAGRVGQGLLCLPFRDALRQPRQVRLGRRDASRRRLWPGCLRVLANRSVNWIEVSDAVGHQGAPSAVCRRRRPAPSRIGSSDRGDSHTTGRARPAGCVGSATRVRGGRYAATSATTRRAGAANPYGAGAIELNAIANGGLMRMLFGDVFDTDAVAPVSCLLNDCSCPVLSPTPERSNKRVSAPGALPPALLVQRHRWRALQSSSRSEAQITSDQPAACTCRSSNHPGAPDSRRGR